MQTWFVPCCLRSMMVSKVTHFAAVSTAIIRVNAVILGQVIARSLMIATIPTFIARFLPPTWSMMYVAMLIMMLCATSSCIGWTMRSIGSRWGETPVVPSCAQSSISCTLYYSVNWYHHACPRIIQVILQSQETPNARQNGNTSRCYVPSKHPIVFSPHQFLLWYNQFNFR